MGARSIVRRYRPAASVVAIVTFLFLAQSFLDVAPYRERFFDEIRLPADADVISLVPPPLLLSDKPLAQESDKSLAQEEPSNLWLENFYICWTTSFDTWSDRHDLFLDSLFIHHPNATVWFLISQIAENSRFNKYRENGYNLKILDARVESLQSRQWWVGPYSRAWVDSLQDDTSAIRTGPYFFTHYTDYLRFYLLFKHGGTYLDVDAITLQTFPQVEFAGLDHSTAGYDWLYDRSREVYIAPGVLRMKPGRSYLRDLLERAFDPEQYDPACHNCVGPKAFGLAFRGAPDVEVTDVQVLPKLGLYPVPFTHTHLLLDGSIPHPDLFGAHLVRTSYSLHLFGKVTTHVPQVEGSVIDRLSANINLRSDRKELGHARSPSIIVVTKDSGQVLRNQNLIYFRMGWQQSLREVKLAVDYGRLAWVDSSIPKTFATVTILSPSHMGPLNNQLSTLAYFPPEAVNQHVDQLRLSLIYETNSTQIDAPVYIFNRMVTFATLGTPQDDKVLRLYNSIQTSFPATRMLACDLSPASGETVGRNQTDDQLHLTWVQATTAENQTQTVLQTADSEYLTLVSDEYLIGDAGIFELMLQALVQSAHDIAASKISPDFLIDPVYTVGKMESREGAIVIDDGACGIGDTKSCIQLDLHAQSHVFMLKREALRSLLRNAPLRS